MTTSIASVGLSIRVAVRIVNEAFLFEEILAACLPGFVNLNVFIAKGIVLDIDLSLTSSWDDVLLLNHADESQQLTTLDLFRIEVVGFRYVEM